MTTAYDTYDYPSYWEGRQYEHESEVWCIKKFLEKIPQVSRVVDVGAGYGRLAYTYLFRSNRTYLVDPSSRLLKMAQKKLSSKRIKYLQIKVEDLHKKMRKNTTDLVLMVRVLHHIEESEIAFREVNRILKKNGFFILEFPNKKHFKATLTQFFKGNFTFPLDIFPKELSKKTDPDLPFLNFHPDAIQLKLINSGFYIIEKRSVSNIRSSFMKNYFSLNNLLFLEKLLQKPLAFFNFGPSVFILAKKHKSLI